MIDEDFSTALEEMTEEEAAELLLKGLINSGSKAQILRDEKGTLIYALILDDQGKEVFKIGKIEK